MVRLTFLCGPQRRHGRDNLLHSLFDHITCFNSKLHLWELHLRKGGSAHLPSLSECVATDNVKQASAIADLRTELRNRFTDFKSNEKSMNLFSTTFTVLIDDVPGNMEMEIIDLQCSGGLKENTNVLGSWIYITNILTRTLFQQSIHTP